MKIRLEFDVSPEEAAEFLQRIAEDTGSHTAGENSRVSVAENVVTALKSVNGKGEQAHAD